MGGGRAHLGRSPSPDQPAAPLNPYSGPNAIELLAGTLLTIHNLHFFLDLMAQARAHLEAGDFAKWSAAWIKRYEAGAAEKA